MSAPQIDAYVINKHKNFTYYMNHVILRQNGTHKANYYSWNSRPHVKILVSVSRVTPFNCDLITSFDSLTYPIIKCIRRLLNTYIALQLLRYSRKKLFQSLLSLSLLINKQSPLSLLIRGYRIRIEMNLVCIA